MTVAVSSFLKKLLELLMIENPKHRAIKPKQSKAINVLLFTFSGVNITKTVSQSKHF